MNATPRLLLACRFPRSSHLVVSDSHPPSAGIMALETSAKTAYNVNDLFVAIGNSNI